MVYGFDFFNSILRRANVIIVYFCILLPRFSKKIDDKLTEDSEIERSKFL